MVNFDWHCDQITAITPVTKTYRSTQNVRRFLKEACGPNFKFNRPFMAWIKDGKPKTMGEVATEWLKKEKESNKSKLVQFPELETIRLKLTKLSIEDTGNIFNLFSDEQVVKYYDLETFKKQSEATSLINLFNSRFDEGNGIRWAIRLKETNDFLGTCGFNSWNSKMKNAVIGYDLLPIFWGKGYTTEAVHKIIQSAFLGKLACGQLNRIQADTIPENVASESVLSKVGFKEEGLRRESGFWKNQFHDLKCYGLIRSEYKEKR